MNKKTRFSQLWHGVALALLVLTFTAYPKHSQAAVTASPSHSGQNDKALLNANTPNKQTARLAIISAFEPELTVLLKHVENPETTQINGVEFTSGTLMGKPVVLFLSGISMVNAAMTTQLVINHFTISHIIFSGIAGGVTPELNIGDVTIPKRWGQYFDTIAGRQTGPDQYEYTHYQQEQPPYNNFGMFFTRPVEVRSPTQPQLHEKFWFEVDPEMLAVAEQIQDVALSTCSSDNNCLSHKPVISVGGNGVSASIFVDNAQLRQHLDQTFMAKVVDMESAACAAVAYSNGIPFIAFRSLSDLAGGSEAENEINTFMGLAAENSARVLLAFLKAWKPS